MLEEAALDDGERAGLSFLAADMRDWRTADPFDLVVAPCSSLSHLLTLEERLAAWRCVYDNLTAGGRFITDLTVPNLTAYADSMQMPPRAFVEIDLEPEIGSRARGCSATRRHNICRTSSAPRSGSLRQIPGRRPRRPLRQQLRLPRLLSARGRAALPHHGLAVEAWFGHYAMRPSACDSRQLIGVGRKPGDLQNSETNRKQVMCWWQRFWLPPARQWPRTTVCVDDGTSR